MISISKAHQIINDIIPKKINEMTQHFVHVPLAEALGCLLAEDIVATMNFPPFDCSMMDGYAIALPHGAEPKREYTVIGESKAGDGLEIMLAPHEAVAIYTGAKIPSNATVVIPIENVQSSLDNRPIIFLEESVRTILKAEQYVRRAGSEIWQGNVIINAGMLLRPEMLALCASMGIASVAVRKIVRVGLLITGNELTDYREPLPTAHHVYDSNTILLQGLIEQAGGKVVTALRVDDNMGAILKSLRTMQSQSDIIITVGGASVGEYDLVRRATRECGYTEHFWGVHQKPGKPMFFCSQNATLLFGLPGNPVSAMMCFVEYVHSVIGKLRGVEQALPKAMAILRTDLISDPERDEFVRVRLQSESGVLYAEPLDARHSSMLTSVVNANGYVRARAGVPTLAGESVTVHIWRMV